MAKLERTVMVLAWAVGALVPAPGGPVGELLIEGELLTEGAMGAGVLGPGVVGPGGVGGRGPKSSVGKGVKLG